MIGISMVSFFIENSEYIDICESNFYGKTVYDISIVFLLLLYYNSRIDYRYTVYETGEMIPANRVGGPIYDKYHAMPE